MKVTGKTGQKIRRRAALQRLETRLAETIKGQHDKYYGNQKESAIKRMENEISVLKTRV